VQCKRSTRSSIARKESGNAPIKKFFFNYTIHPVDVQKEYSCTPYHPNVTTQVDNGPFLLTAYKNTLLNKSAYIRAAA
jgi:hypothetical protein